MVCSEKFNAQLTLRLGSPQTRSNVHRLTVRGRGSLLKIRVQITDTATF